MSYRVVVKIDSVESPATLRKLLHNAIGDALTDGDLISIEFDNSVSHEYKYDRLMTDLAWLMSEFEQQVHHATTCMEKYSADGLTFNSIEVEGYLRASIEARERIKHWLEEIVDT